MQVAFLLAVAADESPMGRLPDGVIPAIVEPRGACRFLPGHLLCHFELAVQSKYSTERQPSPRFLAAFASRFHLMFLSTEVIAATTGVKYRAAFQINPRVLLNGK